MEDTWRGVPNSRFIWRGEWSDPIVMYDGCQLSATVLEDTIWSVYVLDQKQNGKPVSEEEYDALPPEWFEEELKCFIINLNN